MNKCKFSDCTEQDTENIARDIALAAKPGNLIALSGDLGAGKTHFSRAFIRHFFGNHELEVPSPTYLISIEHIEEGFPPILHMDLYRISDPLEIDELGLKDALEEAIILVEWPENAQGSLPEITLEVSFEIVDEETRNLTLSTNLDPAPPIFRSLLIRKFLDQHAPRPSCRHPLGADASVRDYEIIKSHNQQLILMNAPKTPDGPPIRNGLSYSRIAHLAEEVHPFISIAQLLRSKGFCAPEIYAYDCDEGIVLLEHLGDGGILDNERNPIPERYRKSGELLAKLHTQQWPATTDSVAGRPHLISQYDENAMLIEVELLTEWYLRDSEFAPTTNDIEEFLAIWKQYARQAQNFRQSIVLRDYHSPNIIWREHHEGLSRIGLIDFQDAMIGPAVYDLVSLAQDARVIVPVELEAEIIDIYLEHLNSSGKPIDPDRFQLEYAIMGAQRASKLLGIFIRLDLRDAKPAYRRLIPSIRDYMKRNLNHPALEEYRNWCQRVIGL